VLSAVCFPFGSVVPLVSLGVVQVAAAGCPNRHISSGFGWAAHRSANLGYPQVVKATDGLRHRCSTFITLFLLAATLRGGLTRAWSRKEKLEEVIYAEPPGRIEQRMAETRSRMAPDRGSAEASGATGGGEARPTKRA